LTPLVERKILLGGTFTSIGGVSRANIARLNNTPARQQMSYDGSSLAWQRSGTAPEIWRATFEASANGTNWTGIGDGQWSPGGWQLTNLTLSANSIIRARGYVGGRKSTWFAETFFSVDPLTPPVILTGSGTMGFQTNRFGFSVRGLPGQTVTIEASTDLVNWTGLVTFPAGAEPVYVIDPDSAGYPQRFYRAQVQ
jgi:hypothetical protein